MKDSRPDSYNCTSDKDTKFRAISSLTKEELEIALCNMCDLLDCIKKESTDYRIKSIVTGWELGYSLNEILEGQVDA